MKPTGTEWMRDAAARRRPAAKPLPATTWRDDAKILLRLAPCHFLFFGSAIGLAWTVILLAEWIAK